MEAAYNEHLVSLSDHFRDDQKFKHVIKGIVKRLLNTDRHGAPTTSVGNLFQYLTTLSTEEMLTGVQSLNHSCMSCPWNPGRRDHHLPLHVPSQEAAESNEVAAQPPFLQTR